MPGRPRIPIGTFGDIATRQIGVRRYRASARLRDWDGRTRQVTATGDTASAAKAALKVRIAERLRDGDTSGALTAASSFVDVAEAWLEDLWLDADRSDGTKEVYERELRTLVLPTFGTLAVREVTVGRVERFLREQRSRSYARAKHARTILSMVLAFAVRCEIIARNPVKETSRLKKPKHVPKALTIPAFAAEVFRRRMVRLAKLPDDHLIFFTRNGTPLAPHNVRRTLREMLKSVGLDGIDISPHAFRRTGATLLAHQVSIEVAAEVLGHSTPATTRVHYAEPDRRVNAASAYVLEQLAPDPDDVAGLDG